MLIAHLSDPHLAHGPLAGAPAQALAQAIARLLCLDPLPDCVLITGDLADTGDPQEYAALQVVLERCPLPVHLVAGNHDDPAALVARFGGTGLLGGGSSTSYAVCYPQVTIVVADSHQAGTAAGHLGPEQLDRIDQVLGDRPELPALVCLHHPPVPVGIPALDRIRLDDGPRLAEVIARHPHVVRVLAGHVHRTITTSFAGTVLTVAPSTYRQVALRLAPGSGLAYLHEPTGFLLHLLDGSGCVTHLVPVSHASAEFNF